MSIRCHCLTVCADDDDLAQHLDSYAWRYEDAEWWRHVRDTHLRDYRRRYRKLDLLQYLAKAEESIQAGYERNLADHGIEEQ